jgi:hypothetical protein
MVEILKIKNVAQQCVKCSLWLNATTPFTLTVGTNAKKTDYIARQ